MPQPQTIMTPEQLLTVARATSSALLDAANALDAIRQRHAGDAPDPTWDEDVPTLIDALLSTGDALVVLADGVRQLTVPETPAGL